MAYNINFMQFNNLGIMFAKPSHLLKKTMDSFCQDVSTKVFENASPDLLNNYHIMSNKLHYDPAQGIPAVLHSMIEKEILGCIEMYENKFQYFNRMFNFMVDIENTPTTLELERMWFNIQRKGEFLPLHNHSGIYTFVIWAKIPFHFQSEKDLSPNPMTIKSRAGYFQFLLTDSLGKITSYDIPVDKSYEGTICIFPSQLMHQVYPFYSTNDVRISLSGNFRLKLNG